MKHTLYTTICLILCCITKGFAHDMTIKSCQMDDRNQKAIEYVGTRSSGGIAQLELLLLEGLQEKDDVLEVGCGALMSAIPIMSFLEIGHYAGIDPNMWLMEASLQIPENQAV